jgi:hypothetical protein
MLRHWPSIISLYFFFLLINYKSNPTAATVAQTNVIPLAVHYFRHISYTSVWAKLVEISGATVPLSNRKFTRLQ